MQIALAGMCLVGSCEHGLYNWGGGSADTFWERFPYQEDVYFLKKSLFSSSGCWSIWMKAKFAAAMSPEGKQFLAFQGWNLWVSWFVKQFTTWVRVFSMCLSDPNWSSTLKKTQHSCWIECVIASMPCEVRFKMECCFYPLLPVQTWTITLFLPVRSASFLLPCFIVLRTHSTLWHNMPCTVHLLISLMSVVEGGKWARWCDRWLAHSWPTAGPRQLDSSLVCHLPSQEVCSSKGCHDGSCSRSIAWRGRCHWDHPDSMYDWINCRFLQTFLIFWQVDAETYMSCSHPGHPCK